MSSALTHIFISQRLRRCLTRSAVALALFMSCPTSPAQSQQTPQDPTKEPGYIPFTYSGVQAMGVTNNPRSTDASLAQFSEQLLEYARKTLQFSPVRSRDEKPITVLAMNDPTLAKHPDIRDLTMKTLFELNTFQLTKNRIEQSIANQRSRPVSSSSLRRQPNPMRPPPPSSSTAIESLEQDLEARRKAVEANIESRSKLMASKAETPAGQQFLMPSQSPFFLALQVQIIPTQKNPGK
jgi:hypothetical protein